MGRKLNELYYKKLYPGKKRNLTRFKSVLNRFNAQQIEKDSKELKIERYEDKKSFKKIYEEDTFWILFRYFLDTF